MKILIFHFIFIILFCPLLVAASEPVVRFAYLKTPDLDDDLLVACFEVSNEWPFESARVTYFWERKTKSISIPQGGVHISKWLMAGVQRSGLELAEGAMSITGKLGKVEDSRSGVSINVTELLTSNQLNKYTLNWDDITSEEGICHSAKKVEDFYHITRYERIHP